MLLSAIMVVSLLTLAPMTASAQTQTFNYNGFRVTYSITNSWQNNQSVNVTITNTGTAPIRNWALQYDPMGTIVGISNAQLFGSNIVRSVMHNSDIAVGGSVTFSYTLMGVTGTPDSFALCNYRVQKENGYTVTLTRMPDWGSGFTGMINIANTTNAPIMAWELSFNTNFTITSAGDFTILENTGTHYKITGTHNGNIPANSSVTLTFNATSQPNAALSNISLTEVVVLATPPNGGGDDPGDDDNDPVVDDCYRFGGVIAPPSSLNHVNFINGNAADGSRASLNINVLNLIEGTAIKANDIYGIEAVTWGPNTENRQVIIEVNNVASPRFHGSSSAHADRIWAIMSHGNTPNIGGRTEQNTLRYMNMYNGNPKVAWNIVPLAPFVSSATPDSFNVRIRPQDNHASLVTAISLLGANGQALGTATYSTQNANGSWSKFESFIPCLCSECADDDCPEDCMCEDCSEIPIFYHLSAEAEHDSISQSVTVSWTTSEPIGHFEIFYSSHANETEQSLGVFENEFSYIHHTGAEDFIVYYYRVMQVIDDEIVVTSNICYAIWSPAGIDWTDYTREWEINANNEILSEINDNNPHYQLSVNFEAAGVPDVHLNVAKSGYSYAMENDMLLGVIPELIYPEMLSVDNVTLKFEISSNYIDNELGIFTANPEFEGIKRLNVFKWFDEINMSLPIETKFDVLNNTLYTEVDRFGTFAIMDMEMWFRFLGVNFEENEEEYEFESFIATDFSLDDFLFYEHDGFCDVFVNVFGEITSEEYDDEIIFESATQSFSPFSVTNTIMPLTTTNDYSGIDVVFVLQANGRVNIETHMNGFAQLSCDN
jgi:hypothetical protein